MPPQRKKGINIRAAVSSVLSLHGISVEELEKAVYTTDRPRGATIICALQSEQRIDCIAHVINTVLHHTSDDKKMCPLPVSLFISTAKCLVRYIKKSSLQNLIPKGLEQSCKTEWNSTFF